MCLCYVIYQSLVLHAPHSIMNFPKDVKDVQVTPCVWCDKKRCSIS
ncbi:hypothetical protein APHMUC_0926 [Anaplasma phagocytophilum str. ApMUC09]|uniref:Uncharacterized protein n=1 Tax=Anaplasma phagocytophilum str. ApMUC09 TaxID=1359152 RepID=A0A0F3N8G7_ANAPH|nr:hypothetical protein APHMUC_0926 [Anaplasma phagocytophilum str. ApMUC09]